MMTLVPVCKLGKVQKDERTTEIDRSMVVKQNEPQVEPTEQHHSGRRHTHTHTHIRCHQGLLLQTGLMSHTSYSWQACTTYEAYRPFPVRKGIGGAGSPLPVPSPSTPSRNRSVQSGCMNSHEGSAGIHAPIIGSDRPPIDQPESCIINDIQA